MAADEAHLATWVFLARRDSLAVAGFIALKLAHKSVLKYQKLAHKSAIFRENSLIKVYYPS